jgi:hypothetical protein
MSSHTCWTYTIGCRVPSTRQVNFSKRFRGIVRGSCGAPQLANRPHGRLKWGTSPGGRIVVAALGPTLRMLIYTAVSRTSGIDKGPLAVVAPARAGADRGGPGAWHSATKPFPQGRDDTVRQAIAPAAQKKFISHPACRCRATILKGSIHRFR